ncbi:MAG: hypothetical protein ACRDTA_21470 [Pseudonocardiaceae bacterium]
MAGKKVRRELAVAHSAAKPNRLHRHCREHRAKIAMNFREWQAFEADEFKDAKQVWACMQAMLAVAGVFEEEFGDSSPARRTARSPTRCA